MKIPGNNQQGRWHFVARICSEAECEGFVLHDEGW